MTYAIMESAEETGKTTIAINLAIWLSEKGHEVVLVETAIRAPATLFAEKRKKLLNGDAGYKTEKLSSEGLRIALPKLITEDADIIIDVGSADENSRELAFLHADVILIPFLPWAYSMGSINSLVEVLNDLRTKTNRKVPVYTFINMVDEPGASKTEVQNALSNVKGIKLLQTNLSKHKVFQEAADKGCSIFEMPDLNENACTELEELFLTITSEQTVEIEEDTPSTQENIIAKEDKAAEGKLKQVNVSLSEPELEEIRVLRSTRPNPSRSQKKRLAISLHDWIVEAVQEKIERDRE